MAWLSGWARLWTAGKAARSGIAAALAAGVVLGGLGAAAAEPMTVDVVNKSYATKCAEEDNVYYKLEGAGVAGFSIEAKVPSYLDKVVVDSTLPDFSGCTFGHDWAPDSKPYIPPTAILYEDDQFILKGVVYPDFWRPTVVPVKVGKLTQKFLHLVQLWKKTAGGPIEFLVFYPQDGYWRLKSLPPFRMHEVAYGSSFLFGPVEESTRPFVAYKSVEFDPKTLTFTLEFDKGGKALVKVTGIDVGRSAVDVSFYPPFNQPLPFAALRSMYVTPEHADTAEAIWAAAPGGPTETKSVIEFQNSKAAAVTFGRSVPSTHNTSAPDLTFGGFRAPSK